MFTTSQLAIINYLLVYEPASRKHLAKVLSLTNAAITIIVSQLIERGILFELKALDSGKVGRKETLIDVVEDAFYAIGLDVENEKILFSLTNLKGASIDSRVFYEIDEALAHIERLKSRKPNLLGVTVMLRGYINENQYHYRDKDIKVKIEALKIPYLLINNVSALAIAHRFYNFDDENFLMIKYGPGVGSAIMVNGGLVSQKVNACSEIGQMIIDTEKYVRLESCIKYEALSDGLSDENIISYLNKEQEKRKYIINCLTVSIINSHVLLSLDKVIVAGVIFSDNAFFNELVNKIKEVSSNLTEECILRADSYFENRRKIGSIVSIYSYFNGLMKMNSEH